MQMNRTRTTSAPAWRRGPGRRTRDWLIGACAAIALPLSMASSPDDPMPAGFQTEPLLKTGQTRDNDPIAYPSGAAPEITAVTATIEAGGRTPLHEHPVPTFVYVLQGAVELETEGRDPHTYRAGQAYIEALDRPHQLFNRGNGPAKLLVVFVGEQGKAPTVTATAAQ
jgi:quercetin dioxygenase-like cupin family protein